MSTIIDCEEKNWESYSNDIALKLCNVKFFVENNILVQFNKNEFYEKVIKYGELKFCEALVQACNLSSF